MITPKEAATLVDWPNPSRKQEIHDFVLSASARDIQIFLHSLNMETPTTSSREWQVRARAALDIQLAEAADRTAQKLAGGMDTLARLVEDQTKSARILENYTRTLTRLTWALVWLTVGILIFTLCLVVAEQSAHP